ncbi:MAG: PLP-dependent aminotransferase family protein [Lawsonibacter sp.]
MAVQGYFRKKGWKRMGEFGEKRINTIVIDWKPDRDSEVPLYSQIVNYFSEKISSGSWLSGQTLPSQRKLSELFKVNRSTIVEAMEELTSLGMLESGFGRGTKIANDSWSLLMQDKAPDWKSHIKAGGFRSNIPTVQIINQLEFERGVTRMSTGELSPELMQTELTREVLSKLSTRDLFMNYPDPLGMPGLRTAIQDYLRENGIDVPLSNILVVSGALQALQLICMGIVQAKSAVYVESPSYLRSLNLVQSVGAEIKGVPMDDDGILPWMIREPQSSTCHSLLYTIPTFQNPTGCVMPESRRIEVLKCCRKNHMPIIEDDVFRDLWLDKVPPPTIKSMDQNGSVVYIGSLSKCFSPGLRLGWLVGPESVVQRLADVKMQMDYGVSVLTQQVVEELLRSGLYYTGVNTIRQHLRERRDLILYLLEKYFGDLAEWDRPSGGFFIWVRLKHRMSAEHLFNRALKEGLLILPGSVYDMGYSSAFRLTYGYLSPKELESGVKRLAEILKSMS